MTDDAERKLDEKLREALVDFWIASGVTRGFKCENLKQQLLDLLEKKS